MSIQAPAWAVDRLEIVHRDPGATPARWRHALERVLVDPDQPRLVFQPIVDLARGVVAGYEALARFDPPVDVRFADAAPSPEEWFRQARRYGRAAALEARCVRQALRARSHLPGNCFLTVNCGPDVLASPQVLAAFAESPDLTRIIVELTEQVDFAADAQLLAAAAGLRARGAIIAVDDVGSGYAGLTQLLAVRPGLVKLDRELVRDIDRDPAKSAAVELLGAFASRLDAWLLAEGVEREGELDTLVRLGVPLAQGWLFGRPAAPWAPGSLDLLTQRRRSGRGAPYGGGVAALLTATKPLPAGTTTWHPSHAGDARVRTDAAGCPVALHLPLRRGNDMAEARVVPSFLQIHALTSLGDAADRAMGRPAECRFDPLVCVDDAGRYLGLVHIDHLVSALARCHTETVRPPSPGGSP